MLSISNRGSAATSEKYYLTLSEDSDHSYYAETTGRHHGTGAAALGLCGDLTAEQFGALARGIDPNTGEALVHGAGDAHRAGWDLTFTPPKSVSIIAEVAGEDLRQAALAAHQQAVQVAINFVEQHCVRARREKGGATQEQARTIWSVFDHHTSREQDPNLHSHCFLHNLAQRSDGSWGAIESRKIYEYKLAAGAVYRAALAEELQALGIEVDRDGDSFRITGVPQSLVDEFSKRRQQILSAAKSAGATTARGLEIAALATRKNKNHDTTPDELLAQWRAAAGEHGITVEHLDALATPEREIVRESISKTEILEALTANTSIFEERDLYRVVAVAAQGRAGVSEIEKIVGNLKAQEEIVLLHDSKTGRQVYSTRELINLERQCIHTMHARVADQLQLKTATVDQAFEQFEEESGFCLSAEQEAAVRYITLGAGGHKIVTGDAGTGKSTMARAAKIAFESEGRRVLGAALAGKAAAGLQAGSGIHSSTIHSLANSLDAGRDQLTSNDVIIVDEAGMVDSRVWARLQNHADAVGAKIVWIGDHKQLQAVTTASLFRNAADRLGSVAITEIRRQKEVWAKTAVEQFRDGNAAAALGYFIERDLLHVRDTHTEAREAAVEKYFASLDASTPAEMIMMANTNADVSALNQIARDELKKQGVLSVSAEITTRDSDGQSLGRFEFSEGDRILFKKNSLGLDIKNGDLGTVWRISMGHDGWQLAVDLDNGKSVKFSESEYSQIRHGYAVTTHAAQGVTAKNAVVLVGGPMQSREAIYVQMSRMQIKTDIVIDRQQIDELMDQSEPTLAMRELIQVHSGEIGTVPHPTLLTDYRTCRDYIEEWGLNTPQTTLDDLSGVVEAMNHSNQKLSTLDFREVQPQKSEQLNKYPQYLQQQQESNHEYDYE
jgi:Ti-type conjugative transfer relaxase TraA